MATEERVVRVEVGVALSGGGHRATLFALGALLYLADSGVSQNVTIMSSVSGGSLTNGYVAQECDFSSVSPVEFRRVAGRLANVVALRGTIFSSWLTWLYLSALVGLLLGVGAVTYIFQGTLRLILVLSLVVAFGLGLGLRGVVAAAAFGRNLFSEGVQRSRLADINGQVDHVICATDLLASEPFFFSGRFAYGSQRGWAMPGGIKLQTAVQASAALPGAFPPRRFRLKGFLLSDMTHESYTYLVDGGVYNNLATEWIEGLRMRRPFFPPTIPVQATPHLQVIVNASDPSYAAGRSPSLIMRIPYLREAIVIPQIIDVLYANTIRPRIRALETRFRAPPSPREATPLLLQISTSAFRYAMQLDAESDVGTPTRSRAREVEELLVAYQPAEWWDENASRAVAVPTSLNRAGLETSRLLIHHGYTLAMAALHISMDTPLTGRVSVDDVVDSVLPT